MKIKKSLLNKVVKVIWEDASSHLDETLEEILERDPELVETYGKIVHSDKDRTIVMTHNALDNDNCNEYMKIPTSLIREVKR